MGVVALGNSRFSLKGLVPHQLCFLLLSSLLCLALLGSPSPSPSLHSPLPPPTPRPCEGSRFLIFKVQAGQARSRLTAHSLTLTPPVSVPHPHPILSHTLAFSLIIIDTACPSFYRPLAFRQGRLYFTSPQLDRSLLSELSHSNTSLDFLLTPSLTRPTVRSSPAITLSQN